MLSRLISLLRRIPAVKWAFTRLRPVPDSGSIDVTPVAADVSPIVTEDIVAEVIVPEVIVPEDVAEAASADVAVISTVSVRDDGEIAGATPATEDDTAISVMVEITPADAGSNDASCRETPSDIEPAVEETASVSTVERETAVADVTAAAVSNDPVVEISAKVEAVEAEPVAVEGVSEPVAAAELVVSTDPRPAFLADAEPVVAEEASPSSVDVEIAPLDAPALVADDDRSADVIADVEPIVNEPCIASASRDVPAEPVPEIQFDSAPSTDAAAAIEPAVADLAGPVVAKHDSTGQASVVTDIEPAPPLASPPPEVRSAPKVRVKAAEPADRAALIRQRWAESGIRMWNPRLHGTGEATLNIQGSVGLLPPAPGETMPRYDKLEFKMLGGQIVCEGVIVEAPAQPSHRSFTRLAEPGKPERGREPVRERQAVLA